MTTEYYGMTPWEYNEWAKSRETAGDYFYGSPTRSIPTSQYPSPASGSGITYPPSSGGGGTTSGGSTSGSSTSTTTDPYKDIDRSPFELSADDALALAAQQRIRDATDYRYPLAGMPQPIDVWSGSVADTQRTNLPLGTRASLQPGTGAFAPSESFRNYVLARQAYMNDPIAAATQSNPPPGTTWGTTPTWRDSNTSSSWSSSGWG